MSWPLVKLGTVAEINPRLPKDTDESQLVTFLGMASISENGTIISQDSRVLSETKKGFTYFERNDVLLAKITPCFENGKAARVHNLQHKIGYGSTEFHVLRAKPEILDPQYLFYLVWNSQFRLIGESAMKGAAGQKRISADFLKDYEVQLPPLEEQKRIAAILDKADSIRRKRQQAIKLTDEFLRAVFLDMFGDPVTNPRNWDTPELKDQIIHANNGLSRRAELGEVGGSIVLRLQDVQYTGITFEKELNRINLNDSETSRFQVHDGDILFIRVNGNPDYVGRSTVFRGYKEPIFHNDHLIRIKIGGQYSPEFLSYFFNSNAGRNVISKKIKTSAGQHTISQGGIEQLAIIRPPIELQEKFVEVLKKVNLIPYKSIDINLLFSSVSSQIFSK